MRYIRLSFRMWKVISNVESYIQNLAHSRCSARVDVRVRACVHMCAYVCACQGSGGAVEGTRGRLRRPNATSVGERHGSYAPGEIRGRWILL